VRISWKATRSVGYAVMGTSLAPGLITTAPAVSQAATSHATSKSAPAATQWWRGAHSGKTATVISVGVTTIAGVDASLRSR